MLIIEVLMYKLYDIRQKRELNIMKVLGQHLYLASALKSCELNISNSNKNDDSYFVLQIFI